MAAIPVRKWIDALQEAGRYTFLRAEALQQTGGTADSVKMALLRLVRQRRIAKVTDRFFVIVPLEYRSAGCPPASWFIHDLMAAKERPYYVGLLSAAALHGAAHEQPQEWQVVTNKAVRPRRAGRVRLCFFVKASIDRTPVVDVQTPTGAMHVSTPEATAVDLVRYPRAAGDLDHVATVFSELVPALDARRLADAAVAADDLPAAQRLGYLLDHVGARRITAPLAKRLRALHPHSVLLRPGRPAGQAQVDTRWRVVVNEVVEVET